LRFVIWPFIAEGYDERVRRDGRCLGRPIRDGCPTDIAEIISP